MINVLFVCMGNICRSPSGEAVFKALVKSLGLEDKFYIDSAGTIGYHEGEPADSRMQKHAAKRGIQLTSRSRPIKNSDFEKFDYIVAMDRNNYKNINSMDKNGLYSNKIIMMTDFSKKHYGEDVPDPYYGGSDGFELVLDLIQESSEGLLEEIRRQHEF
ncbi:MAG: low molecular weight phosphotyrosine protein phosphatase [Spirochaetales bacterium]|nr:low molecular weight phosphotyrosine protein phosphatase [Spirochaetales bacterium]